MKYVLLLAITVGIATTAFGQTLNLTPGDPARGPAVANAWCSSCHLVGPAQSGPVPADVPTFAAIARRLPTDADVLAAFVANPHPPMPNLNLSRQDIRDVLAYIATLK
jgi:mono/diheme cytochrome c family protein